MRCFLQFSDDLGGASDTFCSAEVGTSRSKEGHDALNAYGLIDGKHKCLCDGQLEYMQGRNRAELGQVINKGRCLKESDLLFDLTCDRYPSIFIPSSSSQASSAIRVDIHSATTGMSERLAALARASSTDDMMLCGSLNDDGSEAGTSYRRFCKCWILEKLDLLTSTYSRSSSTMQSDPFGMLFCIVEDWRASLWLHLSLPECRAFPLGGRRKTIGGVCLWSFEQGRLKAGLARPRDMMIREPKSVMGSERPVQASLRFMLGTQWPGFYRSREGHEAARLGWIWKELSGLWELPFTLPSLYSLIM